MKNRLIKNYVTTGLALLVLMFSAVIWLTKTATPTEAGTIAGYAVILLRSKDSLIGLPAK